MSYHHRPISSLAQGEAHLVSLGGRCGVSIAYSVFLVPLAWSRQTLVGFPDHQSKRFTLAESLDNCLQTVSYWCWAANQGISNLCCEIIFLLFGNLKLQWVWSGQQGYGFVFVWRRGILKDNGKSRFLILLKSLFFFFWKLTNSYKKERKFQIGWTWSSPLSFVSFRAFF